MALARFHVPATKPPKAHWLEPSRGSPAVPRTNIGRLYVAALALLVAIDQGYQGGGRA